MSEPADSKLYNKVKKQIYKKYPKHSAYRSGILVRSYKEQFKKKYGNTKPYLGKKSTSRLVRWFKEEWRNQRGTTGYKFKSDIYRPTRRISKSTPTTFSELSKKQLTRARREKKKKGRVKKFKV